MNAAIGDSVWTKVAMFFVEAIHPETGEGIETVIPRRQHLTVCGVDEDEKTVDVRLPGGHVATISCEDVES